MSGPIEQRSPVVRLFDTFLREENIKWVLGLGVCILLGSSLRLVTRHWVEYTPVWKYLILLTYTGTVFGLGELSYHRLGLRKTGTVLMSLVVLLIPISFLALHWIQPQADAPLIDGLRHAGLSLLLGLNLVWSAWASWRIFHHFLRRPQPTFFVCYLILCLAGAIVPGLPASWGFGLALLLWGVFTIGTVKVNRHVFWLTEEHRLPRIFGFFPILLLGSQFAAVFVLGIAGHVTTPLLGLLGTLVSLPILMTADAVARVFEQRTGGLVRPIPWSISGPLALGITLSAAGVVLALTGWPASPAIVPTAIIAAIAMGIVAHRTQRSAFVWGMLLCIVITYQTSPVFFKELVLQLRDQAAAAVRESRLPYAFYGLTYAPLIIAFSIVSAWLKRRGNLLFARPFQVVASVLPCLLLGVSFTHPSAVFPVAVLLTPLFVGQAVLFRNQHFLVPAAVAFLAAAFGGPQFAERVLQWTVTGEEALCVWIAASGLLLFPGYWCDRWIQRLSRRDGTGFHIGLTSICQAFSLAGTVAAAGVWMSWYCPQFGTVPMGFVSGISLCLLLGCHALRWVRAELGAVTLIFATIVTFLNLNPAGGDILANVEVVCWLLLGQWGASYVLARFNTTRVGKVFAPAAFGVSFCGLLCLFSLIVLGAFAQHVEVPGFSAGTTLLMLAWSLDASRRTGDQLVATGAWGAMFVVATALLTSWASPVVAHTWWLMTWVIVGCAQIGLRQVLIALEARRSRFDVKRIDEESATVAVANSSTSWWSPLEVIVPVAFLAIGIMSLMSLDGPQRIAGSLALVGLLVTRRCRFQCDLSGEVAMLMNWQLLAAAVATASGAGGMIVTLTPRQLTDCSLPVAALAAISLFAFESRRLRQLVSHVEFVLVHRVMLVAVAIALLFGAAQWHGAGAWTALNIGLASVAWLVIMGSALTSAARTQDVVWVWWGEFAGLFGLVYFQGIGVLNFVQPGVEYAVLLIGLALWSAGHLALAHGRFAILSTPFLQTGFWVPLGVLPIAVMRHFGDVNIDWAGANSLPILGAAAFYFWRGMERRDLGTSVLSAVLLNVALTFLWRDLDWTDPQLFLIPLGLSVLLLVEMLRREIPACYHDGLRYLGSLMILVSPTFQIVSGSWLHILTLMVASTLLALLAIGVRVRSLLYTSTAFLVADLIALVARGSIDEPNVLWLAGVVLGGAIIALGAVCENNREVVLARLRHMAAELEQWN